MQTSEGERRGQTDDVEDNRKCLSTIKNPSWSVIFLCITELLEAVEGGLLRVPQAPLSLGGNKMTKKSTRAVSQCHCE